MNCWGTGAYLLESKYLHPMQLGSARATRSAQKDGGAGRNRTGDRGFADLGLTTWLPRPEAKNPRQRRGLGNLERETGFEPATSTLARSHSTAELLPLDLSIITNAGKTGQLRAAARRACRHRFGLYAFADCRERSALPDSAPQPRLD